MSTVDELFLQTVYPNDVQLARYHRYVWIAGVIHQMIGIRIALGVTRKEQARNMGVTVKELMRLEQSDDISLGEIFDYLSALGFAPTCITTLTDSEEAEAA